MREVDQAQKIVRAILCAPKQWVHVITHLSKPTEYAASRVSCTANNGMTMIMSVNRFGVLTMRHGAVRSRQAGLFT